MTAVVLGSALGPLPFGCVYDIFQSTRNKDQKTPTKFSLRNICGGLDSILDSEFHDY